MFINLQVCLATRSVLKIFGHVTRLEQSRASKNSIFDHSLYCSFETQHFKSNESSKTPHTCTPLLSQHNELLKLLLIFDIFMSKNAR